MKRTYALVMWSVLGLSACRAKEPTFEDNMAAGVAKTGLAVPDATGATVPVPQDGVLVFVHRDKVAIEGIKAFTGPHGDPGGLTVFAFDPARAAAEGAPSKLKRSPSDPIIVPLQNVLGIELSQPNAAKRMVIVSAGMPPAQLAKEIVATFASVGVTESYRIVRTKDGKLAAERL